MLRAERKEQGVFGGRSLKLEIELTAETLAEGQAPCPVHPASEGCMDHQLHPTSLVEEPLGHNCLLGWQGAEHSLRLGEILHQLVRSHVRRTPPPLFLRAQRDRGISSSRRQYGRHPRCRIGPILQPLLNPAPQLRDRGRQLVAPSRRFPEPEGNARWLAVRILDSYHTLGDLENAPGHVTELEDVTLK